MPNEEPPFGVPQTPHGPGRSEGDDAPPEADDILRDLIDRIIVSIAPNEEGDDQGDDGNSNPDYPEKLPTGEVPIPGPDDPRYYLVQMLAIYRRIYWESTGHSPIGKVLHHAIEQAVFDYFPEIFDSNIRDSPGNLRAFRMRDNPRIHLSLFRQAWDYIYKRLGITPGKDGGSIPAERLPEVIRGIESGCYY
ncbi:hypothetical protein L5G32_17970 [Gordonia sp. HY002]|uniref:hypothetical protein n=1 Tax=Gordonia zhenghanii TaxID=2911516 RepID=UPI001EF12DA1|nr:hypothetical protein [Gordonia zhenghanii]MCF8572150.1 hypothetical protein [Gordonia zhenghanii]MCF8604266.1 hypothetical protein [Gordonia zhenghanii]